MQLILQYYKIKVKFRLIVKNYNLKFFIIVKTTYFVILPNPKLVKYVISKISIDKKIQSIK